MVSKNDANIRMVLEPVLNNIKMAAIFGSYLEYPNTANDIDLALWIGVDRFDYIKNKLKKHTASTNIYIEPVMCKYIKLPELPNPENKKNNLPIHINFLPMDTKSYTSSELWIRNKNMIRFIK